MGSMKPNEWGMLVLLSIFWGGSFFIFFHRQKRNHYYILSKNPGPKDQNFNIGTNDYLISSPISGRKERVYGV
jgi:hypothetical protein